MPHTQATSASVLQYPEHVLRVAWSASLVWESFKVQTGNMHDRDVGHDFIMPALFRMTSSLDFELTAPVSASKKPPKALHAWLCWILGPKTPLEKGQNARLWGKKAA